MRELEHSRPADIEAESFRIIGAELAERGIVLPCLLYTSDAADEL